MMQSVLRVLRYVYMALDSILLCWLMASETSCQEAGKRRSSFVSTRRQNALMLFFKSLTSEV